MWTAHSFSHSSCSPHVYPSDLSVVHITHTAPGHHWNAPAARFQDQISLEIQKEQSGGKRQQIALHVKANWLSEGWDLQFPTLPLCQSKTRSCADTVQSIFLPDLIQEPTTWWMNRGDRLSRKHKAAGKAENLNILCFEEHCEAPESVKTRDMLWEEEGRASRGACLSRRLSSRSLSGLLTANARSNRSNQSCCLKLLEKKSHNSHSEK